MIHPVYKKSHKSRKFAGVTLIETLVVLTILSGLIAAVGVSFIVTLRSYAGEYKSEAIELEASRAALELEYYASHARRIVIYAGTAPSTSGNWVELTQLDGSVYNFEYVPGSPTGSLVLTGPGIDYTFSTNILVIPTAASPNIFWLSPEGSLSYYWAVDTPSGRVNTAGSVLPGF
jgi:type II secretory pathway pseudopilin PulG